MPNVALAVFTGRQDLICKYLVSFATAGAGHSTGTYLDLALRQAHVPKIDALNAAATKRDIKALNAVEIVPHSSYPKRMIKWRELTVTAIKASTATAKGAKAK